MDDSVSRFWDKHIAKTVACNVSDASRRWYVKHVEAFINILSDRRMAALKATDVTKYLEEIDRKPVMHSNQQMLYANHPFLFRFSRFNFLNDASFSPILISSPRSTGW